MKLKTLVLIGSLIAFSSCEKEEEITINMNDPSLDSRLFGNWSEIYLQPYTNRSFSSDGTYWCVAFGTGKYSVVRTSNSSVYEGQILYLDDDQRDFYYFSGDTLHLYGAGHDGVFLKD